MSISDQKDFPLKIGEKSDIDLYVKRLTHGERQLILDYEGNQYLTNGDGTLKSISSADFVNEVNRLINTAVDGAVHSIMSNVGKRLQELEGKVNDKIENSSKLISHTTMNVSSEDVIEIPLQDLNGFVISIFKFVPGEQDIVKILKEFNNLNKSSFYYDDNISFGDSVSMKIEKEYMVSSEDSGFHKIAINKSNLFKINIIQEEI